MPDRPDDDGLDSWLTERIAPLAPPPGTFDLIKRRARRRKYRRLAITATSAAVIVAAAVTVPQVVNLPVLSPSSGPAAVAGGTSTATASGGPAGTGNAGAESHAAAPRRRRARAGRRIGAKGSASRAVLRAGAEVLRSVRASGPRIRAELTSVRASGPAVRGLLTPVPASGARVRAVLRGIRASGARVRAVLTPVRASGPRVRAVLTPVRAPGTSSRRLRSRCDISDSRGASARSSASLLSHTAGVAERQENPPGNAASTPRSPDFRVVTVVTCHD